MNRLTAPRSTAVAARVPPSSGGKGNRVQPQKPVKDGAKELLSKMREIKAHYNGQAGRGSMSKKANARMGEAIATQPVS